jgi:peptide/nickel transport system substrate-binding protein
MKERKNHWDRYLLWRPSRRSLLRGAALGIAGVTVGSVFGLTRGEEAAASTTPAPAPKRGGTFRVGQVYDITRFDPQWREQFLQVVFDQLTDYDEDSQPTPMLAESWEISSDFTRVRFNLRRGVEFHNGRKFTSEDVKFSYERAKGLTDTNLREARWFRSIETPDAYTVVVNVDQPRPMVFDAFFAIPIVAKEMYDAEGKIAKSAIGTGPFKLVRWTAGFEQVYQRNANYWKSGQPYFDGIVVSPVPDMHALAPRMEADALDASEVSLSDFVRLRDNPRFTGLVDLRHGSGLAVVINTKVPPWDKKTARQALHYAVNRKYWADAILKGLAVPSSINWPMSSPAYNKAKANEFPYDLDRARDLLKEAGVTGKFKHEFQVTTGVQEQMDFALVFQADMAKLGFDVWINPVTTGVRRTRANAAKYQGFDLSGFCCQHLDPGSGLTKSRLTSPTANNSGPYISSRYAAIVDKVLTTTNSVERKKAFAEFTDIFLDEAFVIPLGFPSPRLLTKASVKGLRGVPTQQGSTWSWAEGWFGS